MSALVVIPARYGSTRFPGKPLAPLKGLPVIQHVYQNSLCSKLASEVIVATDHEGIMETVLSFGGKAVMTSPHHESGTDRIAEAAGLLDREYDIIVNVQGDEPLINPGMIDDVISVLDDRLAEIGTLVKKIGSPEEVFNPNVVKAVFDRRFFAIYFSRAPIPYHRDLWTTRAMEPGISSDHEDALTGDWYKHLGIYSYRSSTLSAFTAMPPSRLELTERLEQLRAIENGIRIKVRETQCETFGVDTPEDLERIEKCLNTSL